MKPFNLFLFLIGSLCIILFGCVSAPDLPTTPNILSVSFNTSIAPGVFTPETFDSLIVFVEFEDGDSDLGSVEGEPIPFVSLEDIRTGEIDTFNLTGIEITGAQGSVQGTFRVTTNPCCCCGTNGGIICFEDEDLPLTDEVQFIVRLVDRAGNVSNAAMSPVLTLDCFPE